MKIINVISLQLWPLSNGGARHALNSSIDLSEKNDVAIAITKNSAEIKKYYPEVKIFPILENNSFLKFSPKTLVALIILAIKEKPDLFVFDFPWMGIYGWLIQKIFHISYDIREHNVEHIRFKRLGKWWWWLLKVYEGFVYKNSRKVRYISMSDKKLIKKIFGLSESRFVYTPYIADDKIFFPNLKSRKRVRKVLKLEDKKIILFFGSLDYLPNIQALEIISTKIAPEFIKYKDVVFLIVGKNPPINIKFPNILFTGFVEKVEDYINAADLVIVPLISGGGIRTKIIESIACNKKVISTFIGNEGISGKNICLASINNFVDRIRKEL